MNKIKSNLLWAIAMWILQGIVPTSTTAAQKKSISGIYPHLACYNNEGECGTGAVVPWAGSLWVVTYGPHCPFGSSDKLYRISPSLKMETRSESIGGTPADRMIHDESGQLFIGPYAIDKKGRVRTIPVEVAPGRYTGAARHLTDPTNKLYIATMEEGFYEVDVHDLHVKTLFPDGNVIRQKQKGKSDQFNDFLPGCHGKGLYSGQGVLVFSNNGEDSREALVKFDIESGVLAEWDGKDWKVIRRCQFTELTGPGGIHGNAHPDTDPIWAVGFDYKSVIVGLRDAASGWSFYRLPKASFTYDGAHGWNTEWPRIRNVGTDTHPDYLMTMHGMFWRFPQTFSAGNTAGIRPRSSYLKVIGDFARWHNGLVFGCDDSAEKEFLNSRKQKGNIGGPGQSNSNLWFTSYDTPDLLGNSTASGSVWLHEHVEAGAVSEPFIFAGWDERCAWIKNTGEQSVTYTFQTDKVGNGTWTELKKVTVAPCSSAYVPFRNEEQGEWIRVSVNKATNTSVSFAYTQAEERDTKADKMFCGLTPIDQPASSGGLLYSLGNDRHKLGILATDANGETGYYEMGADMKLVKTEDEGTASYMRKNFAIPRQVVEYTEGAVRIKDDKGRTWLLPLGNDLFKGPTDKGELRICREVATERDLFNCMGTFYELPAENADGFAKIRPIASHDLRVNDYASYRGMLIMTGITPDKTTAKNPHIFTSQDGKACVWAGVIDDLWKLGRPVGHGGPWVNEKVEAQSASDPFLIGYYTDRKLTLSHQCGEEVEFRIEADPTGDGTWMEYKRVKVKPGERWEHVFPPSFQARWIRFIVDKNTTVTTWFDYGCSESCRHSPVYTAFTPGTTWKDNHAVHINAHGGGILYDNGTYYWFGEHKTEGENGNYANVGVHCYSSKDLYNWKDEGIALAVTPSGSGSDIEKGCILERPKVIYNARNRQYVMWFHLEPKGQWYSGARSGIAVSDKPNGPYKFLRSVRPNAGCWPVNALPLHHAAPIVPSQGHSFSGSSLPASADSLNLLGRDMQNGQMARDMNLFVDDDGKAYHIYSSEENSTLHIALLDDDYTGYSGTYKRLFVDRFMEAPTMFKRKGKYYMMMSGCTGWAPNAARSAVADSPLGEWHELGNPCVGEGADLTFRSQSTFILPLQGEADKFIYMGDRWTPQNAIGGTYIWLPIQFKDERFTISWKDRWEKEDF